VTVHASFDELTYRVVEWKDDLHYNLVGDFHRMRKSVFVDTLDWSLNSHQEMEWDQYDIPGAVYVTGTQGGQTMSGCRLLRTDTEFTWGNETFSYMIRDAYLGRLPSIPQSCAFDPPVSPKTWEMTRAISGRDPAAFKGLLDAACNYLKSLDAEDCIFISRPVCLRMGRIWGYDVEAAGPTIRIGNSKWLAVRCLVR
jgi:N-acyl-L-homoserine lactone synthetase